MTLSITRLSWLWRKRKGKGQVSDHSPSNPPSNPPTDWCFIPSVKRVDEDRSRKSKSREDGIKTIDKEYDTSLSVSEPTGPDWAVGWLEPHGPAFRRDDGRADADDDDSFAVLVPCYRRDCRELQAKDLPRDNSSESIWGGGFIL